MSPKITGKSGTVHTLGIVAELGDGSKHGYVVMRDPDQGQIMNVFVTQLDTNLSIHAYYSGQLSAEAEALAQAYSLDMLRLDESKPDAVSPRR